MKLKSLENRIRGWLPKECKAAYLNRSLKPRWRKPYWIALILVSAAVLFGLTFIGATTYMRYSNPAMDITAAYYEKTINCSTAQAGDVVEVNVWVYWHGYAFPEFKRQVKIVDPCPESCFILVSSTNVYDSRGYGGSYHFKYLLGVIGGEGTSTEFPKPRLYLDNVEIRLEGTSPALNL